MARKRKGKSSRNAAKNAHREDPDVTNSPHTFVVQRGHVGMNINALTMDMRKVMEPYTASNLKMRKKNMLKDLVSVAGPLGVTNFIMFSKTPHGTNMRIARLPRGPTLSFQVEKYCLCRDVVSNLKRPQTFEGQFRHPPLLVLNNFKQTQEEKKEENGKEKSEFKVDPKKLCATMLQNMFPAINIQKVKLNHVKRCVAFNYNPETDLIEFRHYNIAAKPLGMTRRMRKLITRKNLPDLSKFNDISEYLTQKHGEGSASESEPELDGPHNEVELAQIISGKGNLLHEQSAVRLTELGPRLTMKLVKAEEGLCDGEVLYHSLIEKAPEEIAEILQRIKKKSNLKQARKAEQETNITRKKMDKEKHIEKTLAGMERKKLEEKKSDSDDSVVEEEEEVNEDAEWYKKEVGEDPDPDMFSAKKRHFGKFQRKRKNFDGSNEQKDHKKRKFTNKDEMQRDRSGLRKGGFSKKGKGMISDGNRKQKGRVSKIRR